ncbi:MAG: hypothetical protein ACJASQ_000083 [Crocinitomicaceae bacterium]|jgi:hypothetical protein
MSIDKVLIHALKTHDFGHEKGELILVVELGIKNGSYQMITPISGFNC